MKRIVAAWLIALSAQGATRYVTQNGIPPNTNSLAGLNAWTNVSPGDTVHLVGTFTNQLNLAGISGTAGNPITFLLEGKFSKPAWGAPYPDAGQTSAAVYSAAQCSYIVFDGGGTGTFECTSNGYGRAFTNNAWGMSVAVKNNFELKGVRMSNILYRVSSPTLLVNCESGRGVRLESTDATNILIHDCIFDMVGNAVEITHSGSYSNIQVYSNTIFNVSFGVSWNAGATPGQGYNAGIWGNYIEPRDAFNPEGGPCAGTYHNCGIKVEGALGGVTNHSFGVYRNDIGHNFPIGTAGIAFTPNNYISGWTNTYIVNNRLTSGTNTTYVSVDTTNSQSITSGWILAGMPGNTIVANNTIISTLGAGKSVAIWEGCQVINNLSYNVGAFMDLAQPSSEFDCSTNTLCYRPWTNCVSDFNVWYGVQAATMDYFGVWDTNTVLADYRVNRATWGEWTNRWHFDPFGITNRPDINTNTGVLLASDTVATIRGSNLTAYALALNIPALTNDFFGAGRPATGRWTIGAIQDTNTTPDPPAATTSLRFFLRR